MTVAAALESLPIYDITEPEVWQTPTRLMSRLRAQTPVARVVPYATYTVLRARDVERLMHDPRLVPGQAGGAPCTALIPGLLTTQSNDVAGKTLGLGMISLDGFTGPVDLMRCELVYASTAPTPADFDLTVVDTAAPDLTPITPEPTIEITIESIFGP